MKHILENKFLKIEIYSKGAELCSVFSKENHLEYIWQANADIWARHAPVLFPIVGKLNQNTLTHQQQTYSLPQHGFARDEEFYCIESSERSLSFELTASEKSLAIYPFHFSLQVTYELTDRTLFVSYQVFNPDNSTLFFSIGAHPGFNCPLVADEKFEDYVLEFPGVDELTCTKLSEGLLTNEQYKIALNQQRLPISTSLFSQDALVLEGTQVQEAILKSSVSNHGVRLISKGWPFYGVWSKKECREFICLEPWYGIADHADFLGPFENKKGIMSLEPFQTFESQYQISFF